MPNSTRERFRQAYRAIVRRGDKATEPAALEAFDRVSQPPSRSISGTYGTVRAVLVILLLSKSISKWQYWDLRQLIDLHDNEVVLEKVVKDLEKEAGL